MPLFINIRNAAEIDFKGNEYDKYKPERWYVEGDGYTSLDRMANKAKEEGYEGMVIKSVKDGTNYPIGEYIAFSPTQVKSATENNGIFDPNDPDIRFRKTKPRGSAARDYNQAVRTPNKGKTVKGKDNLAYRV